MMAFHLWYLNNSIWKDWNVPLVVLTFPRFLFIELWLVSVVVVVAIVDRIKIGNEMPMPNAC